MDLADLKTFLKIAETGSFSAAAEHMHVTQPAISKRLVNLENALGATLIERLPRNARLTQAGELLKTRAEHILREIENTQAEIHNLSKTVTGQLSIATSHHIGLHRLPAQIRKYLKQFPQVDLDLHFLASEEAEKALLAGDVELALLTLPDLEHELLNYKLLWHDPLFFVVGRDHPLAVQPDRENQISDPEIFSQLTQYRAFLPGTETMTFQVISSLFSARKLNLRPTIPTNYLETIKMMVSVGLGWGVLPETMLDNTLVKLPVNANLSRELGVVYDKRRKLSKAAIALLDQLSKSG